MKRFIKPLQEIGVNGNSGDDTHNYLHTRTIKMNATGYKTHVMLKLHSLI